MERLLKLLEENARLSVEELAAMLSTTPEDVAARMDDYAKKGVIRGYRAMVDWEKVSTDKVQAVIELRVRPKRATASTKSPWPSASSTRCRACCL